jgi:hypothetical protein
MGTTSPAERQQQKLYRQFQGFNPQAANRFANLQLPYSGENMIGELNRYTDLSRGQLTKQIGSDINQAGSGVGSALSSRGYGGSILSDAISGARERAASSGQNALTNLMAQRLSLLPSIMQNANQNQLAITYGAQNADFGNIANMFKKYGMQSDLINQAFDTSSTFDDILGVANTAANIFGSIAKIPGIFGSDSASGAG